MDHQHLSETWERGDSYEQYIGRWSRQAAPLFLSGLNIPAGRRWLDVGWGTGALCAAIADRCCPSLVVGVEPSEGFLKTAAAKLVGQAALHRGSAAIPLGDASVDVVVFGLVPNFVPDPHAALLEMARVTSKGGTITAYVWDYGGSMDGMRFSWDAAVELDAHAAELDEGVRFSLCRPESLEKLFAGAGLDGVEVEPIDVATPFADFDDYWQPFLGGQGRALAYAMSLNEPATTRLRNRIRERVPTEPNGSISLRARAWATRATVGRETMEPGRPGTSQAARSLGPSEIDRDIS